MLSVRVKCEECKHIRYDKDYPTCDAFPEGIPIDIFSGEVSHDKSYDGDNGVHFESVE